jgi:arginine decarboxylase
MATRKAVSKKAVRKVSAKSKVDTSLQYLLFNASDRRSDHWNELNLIGGKLNSASVSKQAAGELHAKADALLAQMAVLEGYWAFPGKALFGAAVNALQDADYGYFQHVVARISNALKSESYRRSSEAWDLNSDAEDDTLAIPDYNNQRDGHRPYFEVLAVIADRSEEHLERVRQEIHSLRRPEDPFQYEFVFVSNFEDAMIATIVNFNIQAVVIYDGFPFASNLEFPELDEFLRRHVPVADSMLNEDYATELAHRIYKVRPELDAYLMTDRSVEELAGKDPAPNVRRVFYGVEEMMELHLSFLAGVGERYDAPFFENLKDYARRPVGTWHALPVARGKSIYKSHWIQDMGQFYGANLFLAESSATSGGLDSLLEPTGNIKLAHEKAARCFGADHTYFVTNGTSTANKIVVQGVCKPGDIAWCFRVRNRSTWMRFRWCPIRCTVRCRWNQSSERCCSSRPKASLIKSVCC